MSELQQYYNDFCTGYWANEDPKQCRCRGSGWALSEVDTFHKCPIHYNGQEHPECDSFSDEEEALMGVQVLVWFLSGQLDPKPVAPPSADDDLAF